MTPIISQDGINRLVAQLGDLTTAAPASGPEQMRRTQLARYVPPAVVAALGVIAAVILARDVEAHRSWELARAAAKPL